MTGELAALRAPGALPGASVGLCGAVAAPTAVPFELARDRRGSTTETSGDRSRRLARCDAAGDLFPLLERQRELAAAPLAWRHASVLPDRAMDGAGRSVERSA